MAESIAQEVEAEHCDKHGTARREGKDGRSIQVLVADLEHRTPTRGRRLHTETQKAQSRLGDDGLANQQRGLHDDSCRHIGPDVVGHDPPWLGAGYAGCGNEFTLAYRKGLPPRQTREVGCKADTDAKRVLSVQGPGYSDCQRSSSSGKAKDIDQAHKSVVDPPAIVAGQQADEHTYHQREAHCANTGLH